MKLFILGDTHGSKNEIIRAYQLAVNNGADKIVQVGDFGYWGESAEAQNFIAHVSKFATRVGIPFHWIDGNHEAHTQLRETYGPGGIKHEPTPLGFWEMLPNLYYIPRGTKWVWDDVTFMGVGGAVSIDKDYRLARENGTVCEEWGWTQRHVDTHKATGPHTMWWPEEAITREELDYAKSRGEVDVLFTHDTITGANFGKRLKIDPASQEHREKIDELVRAVKPKIMFHGHYHTLMHSEMRYQDGYTEVWGVGCDGMPDNYIVFDTEKYFTGNSCESTLDVV